MDLGATLIDQMPSATPSKQLSAMLLSAPGFIPSQNGRIHVRGSHGQIQYVVDGVPMTDEVQRGVRQPARSALRQVGRSHDRRDSGRIRRQARSGRRHHLEVRIGRSSKSHRHRLHQRGSFDAVDGGATVGGRLTPRLGYFVSAGGNRTDRYLDPPTADNFHNAGHANRFNGKLELRPTDADFVRAVSRWTAAASRSPTAPDARGAGVDTTQDLTDNSQTVTWLHQLAASSTLDVVAYRRAAERDARRARTPSRSPRRRIDRSITRGSTRR